MKRNLPPEEQHLQRVRVYKNSTHDWDRLQVPAVFFDPFAHLGSGGDVRAVPNVEQAYKARRRVVSFFVQN